MTESEFNTLLFQLLRIRRIEEAIADHYKEGEMRCPIHLCIGQEAIAVGVCANLSIGDKVFSNHRAHGHYLAKGGNLDEMIAELYGRDTGCCGGRGGSMHLIDQAVGFMGATPIVGGTVPLAVGAAWATSLSNEKKMVVIFFGDGCFEEGVVHESMNFAALHRLPILFACENNNFSVFTSRKERQPSNKIYKIALSHGIKSSYVDGNDLCKVISEASKAINSIRIGEGPYFLEFGTYRWREHCGPDFDNHLGYRNQKEVTKGLNQCPIERFKAYGLRKNFLHTNTVSFIEKSLDNEIEKAFAKAKSSRKPTLDDAKTFIYAE